MCFYKWRVLGTALPVHLKSICGVIFRKQRCNCFLKIMEQMHKVYWQCKSKVSLPSAALSLFTELRGQGQAPLLGSESDILNPCAVFSTPTLAST